MPKRVLFFESFFDIVPDSFAMHGTTRFFEAFCLEMNYLFLTPLYIIMGYHIHEIRINHHSIHICNPLKLIAYDKDIIH